MNIDIKTLDISVTLKVFSWIPEYRYNLYSS